MVRVIVLCLLGVALAACAAPPREVTEPSARPIPTTIEPGLRFADYDPHAWTRPTPASYPVHGLDVARFQGTIDWRRVRGAGITFAFIKATEGGDLLDPTFQDNWRRTRQAGIARSAYHFFYWCRPAREQASWFIRNVPRDGQALPHVLDLEWNPQSPTCRRRPPGAEVRAEADVFLDRLEAHYGTRPIIYTTVDFYRETGIGQLRGTEFWLRSVADHPSRVYPGQSWRFWQYTGTGAVPGVVGPVDINVFRGSAEAFERWKR